MEQRSFEMTNELEDLKYYWSPSVRWEINGCEVRIEIFSYKDFALELFPKFYFLTHKGICKAKLIEEFPGVEPKKLARFIDDLIRKRVLTCSVLTPQEVFFPQSYIFQNKYNEKIVFDAAELQKFKEKQLQRCIAPPDCKKLFLENAELPEWISGRCSYRTFNRREKITYGTFSKLFSVFKQIKSENGTRYYYASAGGLYPVDVYVYVKENRVDSVEQGIYYYSPLDNSLNLIDNNCTISKEAHYFTNQAIFDQSAFSIFFIYNVEANMPKYGGMAYFYACVDSGIMVSALTAIAELHNIGICSIGDMQFGKIHKYFKLNQNQVFLHALEAGLKPETKIEAGQLVNEGGYFY